MKKRLTASLSAALVFACAALSGCVLPFGVRCGPPDRTGYNWVLGCIESSYLYYDETDFSDVVYGDIDALVSKLDVYSAYYTPTEYDKLMSGLAGNNVGIGINHAFEEGKGELVTSVTGNSPAYAAGIKKGEYLTGCEYGGETFAFTAEKGVSEIISSIPVGENFTLTGDRGSYTLARAEYTASYAYMATDSCGWIFSGEDFSEPVEAEGEKLSYLPEGYAYLKISRFYGDLGAEVGKLMNVFSAQGCTDLIIDLRDDGGGDLEALRKVAGCFGPASCAAITAKFRGDYTESYYPAETEDKYRLPEGARLHALANVNTASASEALLGYLISCDLLNYGDIYLSDYPDSDDDCRTYGKGIMQTTYKNAVSGEGVRLTTARIYWANGVSIHGRGLTVADGCKTVDAAARVTYGDEELQLAVSLMSGGV